ncbi:unnamed protein product, partial [Didymodactylos carnosus]
LMLDKGFGKEISVVLIICIKKADGCKWSGKFKDYQAHLATHRKNNHQCEYCKAILSSKYSLAEHQKHLCRDVTQLCLLAKHGCLQEKIPRSDMARHYLTEQHQTSIHLFLQHIMQVFQSRPDANNLTTTATPGIFDLSSLLSITDSSSSTVTAINDCYSQLQQMYETLTTLTPCIPTLSEDSIRLSIESLSHKNLLEWCHNEKNQLKQSIVEIDSYNRAVSANQEMLQQEISSVKQKAEDLKSISYDGTLTWKISNVSEKMADAESERQTSIYSPHFYSSPTGYKMRIRLYLHGDGNARRTHMSLFFLLMRGEYDAILKWPFNFKVTFCLFDQSGQQKHIIDSFRPDIKSNSFQRPRSEMNIASGIPKFFPLSMILQDNNDYIKNDIIYIKCIIDFGDISKIILPYALSLNPALPHHVQRNMIQTETDRRLQLQQQQPSTPATTITTTNNSSNTFQIFNNNNAIIVQDTNNSQPVPPDPAQNASVMNSSHASIMTTHSPAAQQQCSQATASVDEQLPPSKKKKKNNSDTNGREDDIITE